MPAGAATPPDFRYPKTVAAEAERQLQAALRAADGVLTVDALVRYALAKSTTLDNLPAVVQRVETIAEAEVAPDTRALLLHLAARLRKTYATQAPPLLSPDEAEAERMKADSLVRLSVADTTQLRRCAINRYADIIVADATGRRFCPTLHDFLMLRGTEVASDSLRDAMLAEWATLVEGDTATSLLVLAQTIDVAAPAGDYATRDERREAACRAYADREESGLILAALGERDERLGLFRNYVARFPRSPFAPAVRNKIAAIEAEEVSVVAPKSLHAGDSCRVSITSRNVRNVTVSIYETLPASDGVRVGRLVTSQEAPPFAARTGTSSVALRPLPYGRYWVAVAPTGSSKKKPRRCSPDELMVVTDLALFAAVGDDGGARAFVVDSRTGRPVEGACVAVRRRATDSLVATLRTDGEGCVRLATPAEAKRTGRANALFTLTATMGDDRHGTPFALSTAPTRRADTPWQITAFTDLGLYRPGETVRYTALLYALGPTERHLVPNEAIAIELVDHNHKAVATDTIVTDSCGQVAGAFTLPADRLNGTFRLRFRAADRATHTCAIDVSEYRIPTFHVDLSGNEATRTARADISIGGTAATYTGLPIARRPVTLTLRRRTWRGWLRSGRDEAWVADTTLTTDADGHFEMVYPATIFAENDTTTDGARRQYHTYVVAATVTDAAGESHEATTTFHIGRRRGLSLPSELTFLADSVTLPLVLQSTAATERDAECEYRLRPERDTLTVAATGRLTTARAIADFSAIPSGAYLLDVAIVGDTAAQPARSRLLLYRAADALPPVDTALWMPACGRSVAPDGRASLTIGTTLPECHLYYMATGSTRLLAEGWLHYGAGLHTLRLRVPDGADEVLTVRLAGRVGGRTVQETVRFASPHNADSLAVRIETFRDRLVPGAHERWTFRLVGRDGTPRRGAMLVEMYRQALEDLAPHAWRFAPGYHRLSVGGFRCPYVGSVYDHYFHRAPWVKTTPPVLPELQMYGQPLFAAGRVRTENLYLAHAMKKEATFATADAVADDAAEEVATSASAGDLGAAMAGAPSGDTTRRRATPFAWRTEQLTTALWMPQLRTDSSGVVAVDFDVPDEDAAWAFQALAFTPTLATAHVARDIIVQKRLSVRLSPPRFLRSGDHATIAASVSNAADTTVDVDVLLELFQPRTERVVASHTVRCRIGERGTSTCTIPWVVADTLPYVAFRVRAFGDAASDGEQRLIPILPAATPTLDVSAFRLAAGDTATTVEAVAAAPKAIFEYCANPLWSCVAALPTLLDEEALPTAALVRSLYARLVAEGVVRDHPAVGHALAELPTDADSVAALVPLMQMSEVKIATLLASPWMDEAERQQARTMQLRGLLDEPENATRLRRLAARLRQMQNADGGFGWLRREGCPSSLPATQEVLLTLGELRQLGYLPADSAWTPLIRLALAYCDREEVKQASRLSNPKTTGRGEHVGTVSYAPFMRYAYIRTLFADIPPSAAARDLVRRTVRYVASHWGDLATTDKARAVLLLNRSGESREARNAAESLRQYADTRPDGALRWADGTTIERVALILRALHETGAPADEEDRIRLWLLAEKRTTDWGNTAAAATALHALLSTGTPWLATSAATITLDGDTLLTLPAGHRFGHVSCRLPLASSGGSTLRICRPDGGGPAWGGIYMQRSTPVAALRAASSDDISIHRELRTYDKHGRAVRARTLHPGDRVQVRLTLRAAQDLAYVTVIDDRAACLEPVDSHSGLRFADGLSTYHETKDRQTRFYIDRLPRGTHVLTYDLHVTATGSYVAGAATAQCQYAPAATARTAALTLRVEP